MAFGVPAIVEGRDLDGGLAARMKGREPDLCLAITKKGESTMKAPVSLVPVKYVISPYFPLGCADEILVNWYLLPSATIGLV